MAVFEEHIFFLFAFEIEIVLKALLDLSLIVPSLQSLVFPDLRLLRLLWVGLDLLNATRYLSLSLTLLVVLIVLLPFLVASPVVVHVLN
jgi:hypothetical protein